MVKPIHIKPEWSTIYQLAKLNKDEAYASFVCKFSEAFYLKRVRNIDYLNFDKVLDVGCGYGQWTYSLALSNRNITALEINHSRLNIAKNFIESKKINNVDFIVSSATKLPFPDKYFDAIFCYGVLMFLPRHVALKEFYRVLKPGGKLYICTNGQGWWLKSFLKFFFKKTVRAACLKGFLKGSEGTVPNATNRQDVTQLLDAKLWDNPIVDFEGCIGNIHQSKELMAYQGKFCGIDSVIEFIATKKNTTNTISKNSSIGLDVIKNNLYSSIKSTLALNSVNYNARLSEHSVPRPSLDLVNNHNPFEVHRAICDSKLLPVEETLREVFDLITSRCVTQSQKFFQCLFFAQKHFFHHFAGQPMDFKNDSILNPITSLVLKQGRCGVAARFLVDICIANGIPARLLTGACHTSAEVLIEAKWILADASLFPVGIFPKNEDGLPLSLEEAINNFSLLDRTPSYINYHVDFINLFLREYPETQKQIGLYLRNPIFPSVGFFGKDFLGSTTKACRYIKNMPPSEWTDNNYCGWSDVSIEQVPFAPVETLYRPSQACNFHIEGGYLKWESFNLVNMHDKIVYYIYISYNSRGWSYDDLPFNNDFTMRETAHFVTDNHFFPIADLLKHGRYVTILAKLKEFQGDDFFYLPSNEHYIGGFTH